MSRGTRQKLGLVLTMAHDPRLLVLDEPTSGLDPVMQGALKQELRSLADKGHTVFFSSHSLAEVEQLCERVAILRRGKVVVDSTLDDLRDRSAREVRIRWQDGNIPETDFPEGLVLEDRNGASLSCRHQGEIEPLIRWLSEQKIDDVSISPPNLENLFHEYYRE